MFDDIAPKRHVALAETPHLKHDCAEFYTPGKTQASRLNKSCVAFKSFGRYSSIIAQCNSDARYSSIITRCNSGARSKNFVNFQPNNFVKQTLTSKIFRILKSQQLCTIYLPQLQISSVFQRYTLR